MFKEFTIDSVIKMVHGRANMAGLELVRGVSIDSRTTKPGDLFFALKGEHTDGHLYTKEALINGSLAVVVENHTNVESEILVSDTLFALGQFAQRYRNLFNPKTIAITGTNGKTTVKNLISAILNKKYKVLSTKKNYNSLIGLPLTIFDLSADEDFLIVEMGTSTPGEIKRLCEIAKPYIGVITNIGPGHLKGLNSIAGVRQEKLALIDSLPDDGFAVVGEGVGDINKKNFMRFSLDMLDDIKLTEYGSYFNYNEHQFFTSLLGIGNVYNCLAAICLTSNLGVEYDFQCDALEEIKPESGRLEPIHHNGLFIINDSYNANPVSMKTAIDFATSLKRRKIFVLGDMLELGRQSKNLHHEIGRYAKKRCDLLFTYGDNADHYQGKCFKDKDRLIRYLIENLNGDEVILIKASRALHFEYIVDDLLRLLR
ncbi:MAG: UDP-N-acetylmuramoyl-tripeptide--D-alanyl-D-alanine ligase [bacterium]